MDKFKDQIEEGLKEKELYMVAGISLKAGHALLLTWTKKELVIYWMLVSSLLTLWMPTLLLSPIIIMRLSNEHLEGTNLDDAKSSNPGPEDDNARPLSNNGAPLPPFPKND
ncbi:hypothetical protein POM88_049778 [Heracleum sosnowskyi]|uniref:Uncharacterized protein n=1 Tax=Heracleum sosnowskyi TaxID=360622 RepID=A0AAD8M1V9_9APIA|nr:hypothetical protein POM88_049778 [Heracleum sosnowskyi]